MKVRPMKERGSVVLEVGDRDETLLTSAAGGEAPFRIKDILVPIDFSECSKKALRYAIPLAKAQGAKLTLLNVVPSHSAMGQTAGVDFTAITSPLRAAAQKRLAALAADEVRGEVLAKSFVRAGLPSAEVLAEARSLPTDLIVISTHGHTGVTHLILGSVAEHVVRSAPCPVLVVREKEHEFLARAGKD
jgi:universal stress protein A